MALYINIINESLSLKLILKFEISPFILLFEFIIKEVFLFFFSFKLNKLLNKNFIKYLNKYFFIKILKIEI